MERDMTDITPDGESAASLHKYATGEYVRAATYRECVESLRAGEEGAFRGDDGVTYYVAGLEATASTVAAAIAEAEAGGDSETAEHLATGALDEVLASIAGVG